jgi:Flp pilus assembly protein TadD
VFILLPLSSDWRWMLKRKDSPWYPTAHLLRQEQAGNWNDVLQALSSALAHQLGLAASAASEMQNRAPSTKAPEGSLEAAIGAHKAGDFAKAAALYRAQLELSPDDADVRRLLGASLLQGGLAAQAMEEFDHAVQGQGEFAETWVLRGRALSELGRYAEAAQSLDRALALAPDNAKTWTDHGHALQSTGNFEQALRSFEQAAQLDPNQPQYAVHLAVTRLTLGDFERGWAGHEARLLVPELSMVPPTNCPYWDGVTPLEGRRLLVSGEQGLGDTIQFCRYAPLLAARGARVIFGAQFALQSVLRSLAGVDTLLTEGDVLPRIDLQCWLMSLPYLLHTTLESIPAQSPYLFAPRQAVERWHARLGISTDKRTAGSIRRIGIACSGNPTHNNDRHRSMSLSVLAPLVARLQTGSKTAVQWHLLQPQLPSADEPWLPRLSVYDHRAQLKDFGETAALIGCMDAIVSVDTSVAHLAGALGATLYVLLPINADWRWMTGRDDSPWYPGAKLLRQRRLDDWSGPLNELEQLLLSQPR